MEVACEFPKTRQCLFIAYRGLIAWFLVSFGSYTSLSESFKKSLDQDLTLFERQSPQVLVIPHFLLLPLERLIAWLLVIRMNACPQSSKEMVSTLAL